MERNDLLSSSCGGLWPEIKKMEKKHHFLLVGLRLQSHLTPMLNLASRLTGAGAHVTLSTSIFCYRQMFPDNPVFPFVDERDPLLCYFPYSDGFDEGLDPNTTKREEYWATAKAVGSRTLRSIASMPATDDKPAITCIVYSLLLQWTVSIARDVGVPAVNFWIQPAAVFAIYYHYFHGYKDLIYGHMNDPNFSVEFPGLFPLQNRDLPSFLAAAESSDSDFYSFIAREMEEMFVVLDQDSEKNPIVLVNSFESLEEDVIREMKKKLTIVPIGPMITRKGMTSKKIVTDKKNVDTGEYMVWLEQWPEKSVIYLSFGSLSLLSKKQNQEFSSALVECGRPFLWVVRGDREGIEVDKATIDGGKGMVVGWCSQVEVLSHSSIGCFVTHCGWNSTLESLDAGVPTATYPQWSDQATNSRLVEGLWKTGVRMKVDEDDGVVKREELKRCLDLLMGEGDIGVEIRRNAQIWKEKAREAAANGGSSYCNLMDFIETSLSLNI